VSTWTFLGKYAVKSYPSNPPTEYVLIDKKIIGYCQLGNDQKWTYYHFPAQEKGQSKPPEPVATAVGHTAAEAASKGLA
jgi:hypothetical protein